MKQRTFLWALLAALPFFLPSCAPHEAGEHGHEHAVNLDTVRAAIQKMENAYAVAENAKDVEAVAVYYANDAQSLANDEPTRVGSDAIKAGIKKNFEEDTMGLTVSFEVTGVWAAGNYATETGTSTYKDKDGKVVSTGK